MTKLKLFTIEYTTAVPNLRSDKEVLEEVQDYIEDRDSWMWKEGWTLELVKKDGNIYTFQVDGEYADEFL